MNGTSTGSIEGDSVTSDYIIVNGAFAKITQPFFGTINDSLIVKNGTYDGSTGGTMNVDFLKLAGSSGTFKQSFSTTINDSLLIEDGTYDAGAFTVILNNKFIQTGGNFTATGGSIRLNGTIMNKTGGNFSQTGGTFQSFSTASTSLDGKFTFYNVLIRNASVTSKIITLSDTINIIGNLTIQNTQTNGGIQFNNSIINIYGNITNTTANGRGQSSADGGTSTFNLIGGNKQTIDLRTKSDTARKLPFIAINKTNSTDTVLFRMATTNDTMVNFSHNFEILNGRVITAGVQFNSDGDAGDSLFISGSSELIHTVNENFIQNFDTIIFELGSNMVFAGDLNQNIPSYSYSNLTLSTNGNITPRDKRILNNLTILDTLFINDSASFVSNGFNLTVRSIQNNIFDNGINNTDTIFMNGTSKGYISGKGDYGDVVFLNNDTTILSSDSIIFDTLTIANGAIINALGNSIGIKGNWQNNAGSGAYHGNPGQLTAFFGSALVQHIIGETTFNNVIIANDPVNFDDTLTILDTLFIAGLGNAEINDILTVRSIENNEGIAGISNNDTISMNGTSTGSIEGDSDFGTIIFSNPNGTNLLTNDLTFNNIIIAAGGVLDPNTTNFNVTGNWINNQPNSGFTPDAGQTVHR
jgi:hypothetical protein